MLYFSFLLLFLKSVLDLKHVWQMIISFQRNVPIAVPKGNVLAVQEDSQVNNCEDQRSSHIWWFLQQIKHFLEIMLF